MKKSCLMRMASLLLMAMSAVMSMQGPSPRKANALSAWTIPQEAEDTTASSA